MAGRLITGFLAIFHLIPSAVAVLASANECPQKGPSLLQKPGHRSQKNLSQEEAVNTGARAQAKLSDFGAQVTSLKTVLYDTFVTEGFACNRTYKAADVALDNDVETQVVEGERIIVSGKITDSKGQSNDFQASMVVVPSPEIHEMPSSMHRSEPSIEDKITFEAFIQGAPCPTLTLRQNEKWRHAMGYRKLPKSQLEQFRVNVSLTQDQIESLPPAFDWSSEPRLQGSKALAVRDQGGCGSCWAFAYASAISDRFFLNTEGKTNIHVSIQEMVCGVKKRGDSELANRGCEGGSAVDGHASMNNALKASGMPSTKDGRSVAYVPDNADDGIVDEACLSYDAGERFSPPRCPASTIGSTKNCFQYKVEAGSFGFISDIANIQHELMTNGPVTSAVDVYQDFADYKGGVYVRSSGVYIGAHATKMLGWGHDVESGLNYWRGQNSWGKSWGENGFYRIRRGTNENNVESEGVFFSTPFTDDICDQSCAHGFVTLDCGCTCEPHWSGPDCSTCVRPCNGLGTSGGADAVTCNCFCKEGFSGPNCELQTSLSESEVTSGSQVTFAFDVRAVAGTALDISTQSRLVAFPEGTKPYDNAKGWAVSSITPILFNAEGKGVGSTGFSLSVETPGKVHFYIMRPLGKNEFGIDRGFSQDLISVGSIYVNCPDTGCPEKEESCEDAAWIIPNTNTPVKDNCALVTQYNMCSWQHGIDGLHLFTIFVQEICLKSCGFCNSAADAVGFDIHGCHHGSIGCPSSLPDATTTTTTSTFIKPIQHGKGAGKRRGQGKGARKGKAPASDCSGKRKKKSCEDASGCRWLADAWTCLGENEAAPCWTNYDEVDCTGSCKWNAQLGHCDNGGAGGGKGRR
eukprot:TRINITY_DN77810_c0_g1_i1.p1 TRINITY_DN77810_c0_g1~~TRINITY_DN77810_c0_g1_i1.p1  ORF type:complete len:860 (-),score=125.13 TRINITY_DN77810_c0_g1_i1:74-2653(-)